jgi:hypothetical protein
MLKTEQITHHFGRILVVCHIAILKSHEARLAHPLLRNTFEPIMSHIHRLCAQLGRMKPSGEWMWYRSLCSVVSEEEAFRKVSDDQFITEVAIRLADTW